jgi:hypothetical protein
MRALLLALLAGVAVLIAAWLAPPVHRESSPAVGMVSVAEPRGIPEEAVLAPAPEGQGERVAIGDAEEFALLRGEIRRLKGRLSGQEIEIARLEAELADARGDRDRLWQIAKEGLEAQFLASPLGASYTEEDRTIIVDELIGPLGEIPTVEQIGAYLAIDREYGEKSADWNRRWAAIMGDFEDPAARGLLDEKRAFEGSRAWQLGVSFTEAQVAKL